MTIIIRYEYINWLLKSRNRKMQMLKQCSWQLCYMMWTILSFLRTLMLPRKMQLIVIKSTAFFLAA